MAITEQQWGAMNPAAPGQTFSGNLYRGLLGNNGVNVAAYDAIKNDSGFSTLLGKVGTGQESIDQYKSLLNPYYEVTAAPAAQRTGDNISRGAIYDQLQQQAKDNGYSWESQSGNYNAFDAAGLLSTQGISSLDQLGFDGNGSLINKATGQALTTREKDQLGMSAKGDGRVDYDIRKDANGNPMIVPKWKSSTTNLGVAGKLLPIAASFIPGFGPIAASALSAGLSIAQGGEAWDAIKAAGMTYGGHQLGSWAGDKLGQYAADNGLSMPSFGGSSGTGTDYSLGNANFGDGFTTGDNGLGSGMFGNSTGTAGGTGAGLSINPGTWGGASLLPTGSGGLLNNLPSIKTLASNVNPTSLARPVAALLGGASGAASGASPGGYKDDGYRPTISRGGWNPHPQPTLGGPSGIGAISMQNKGQTNDGLWRYGLLGG